MLMLQEEQHEEGSSSFGGRSKKTFQWSAILEKKVAKLKPPEILPAFSHQQQGGSQRELLSSRCFGKQAS